LSSSGRRAHRRYLSAYAAPRATRGGKFRSNFLRGFFELSSAKIAEQVRRSA
jgi:hypothetical protein